MLDYPDPAIGYRRDIFLVGLLYSLG